MVWRLTCFMYKNINLNTFPQVGFPSGTGQLCLLSYNSYTSCYSHHTCIYVHFLFPGRLAMRAAACFTLSITVPVSTIQGLKKRIINYSLNCINLQLRLWFIVCFALRGQRHFLISYPLINNNGKLEEGLPGLAFTCFCHFHWEDLVEGYNGYYILN